MLRNKSLNNKGITLIALVITIIVLLILAGVTISMLNGENGILKQAVKAKTDTEKQVKFENIKLAITSAMTNKNHTLDKNILKDELNKSFDNVSIAGEKSLIIEINGEIYIVNKNGILSENNYVKQQENSYTGKTILKNASSEEIVNYKIFGNSVQDGTPTADNEIDIVSVGDLVKEGDNDYDKYGGKYRISVIVSGKNLFDKNKITQKGITNIEYDEVNYDCYSIWGYSNPPTTYTTNSNFKFDINLKKDKKYTVSLIFMGSRDLSNRNGTLYMPFLDEEGNNQCFEVNWNPNIYNAFGSWQATSQPLERVKFTITPTENIVKGALCYYHSGHCAYVLQDSIQIEEGSSVTDYEEYIEPIITNIYLDEPLRKIGDYADYIDFENKKVVRNVEVIDDTGILTLEQSLKGLEVPTEKMIELPVISTSEGTNIITIDTLIKPSNMEITYLQPNN